MLATPPANFWAMRSPAGANPQVWPGLSSDWTRRSMQNQGPKELNIKFIFMAGHHAGCENLFRQGVDAVLDVGCPFVDVE
eukprot:4390838-Amphidinium_carterae.1